MAIDLTNKGIADLTPAPRTGSGFALAFFNKDLILADRVETKFHDEKIGNEDAERIPTAEEIRFQCQRLQANWDEREKLLRRFRAQMACQYGVCRNN